MRKGITFVFAGLLMIGAGFGVAVGQDDKQIAGIRAEVAAINKGAARYARSTRFVSEFSTEGTEAVYFHKGTELKKITAKIYGETFNASAELYFKEGEPLFYFLKINRYDTQIGLPKPVKVVRVEEQRFYIAEKKLIRLLLGKKEIKESDAEYAELRGDMYKMADDLKAAYAN